MNIDDVAGLSLMLLLDTQRKKSNPKFKKMHEELKAHNKKIRLLKYLSQISTKVGRNEKCPCGSNVKFKKCHYPLLNMDNDLNKLAEELKVVVPDELQ